MLLFLPPLAVALHSFAIPALRGAAPRTRLVVASALDNGTLTVGDALAGSLTRQLTRLPDDEQIARAERNIDALLAASTVELDALQADFDRALRASADNTTRALQQGLLRTEKVYRVTLNRTADALDAALVPSRAGVRVELDALLAEQAARSERKRREIAAAGVGRSSTWRDTAALARARAQPRHPVVRVCEASSLILGMLMLLATADLASSHAWHTPPRAAHARFTPPRRTGDYRVVPLVDAPTDTMAHASPSPSSPASSLAASAPHRAAELHAPWWRLTRATMAVWLVSLGAVIGLSGSEPSCALALGLEPATDTGGGTDAVAAGGSAPTRRPSPGVVRFEYDWAKDAWREV